jgi:hypothetical protein
MVTFLFWNLNKQPLTGLLTNLAVKHEVDVLVLAECSIPTVQMLEALNRDKTQFHATPSFSEKDKLVIYTRFSSDFLTPMRESARLTIRHLTLPARTDLLLAAIHFPSKLHWSESSQQTECSILAREISAAEELIGHRRTVLVGDLNMNPFEKGVIAAAGLHAVMTGAVASKGERTVQSRQYPFFYNPMWSHFGDARGTPPGTYYYESSEHDVYFWNMFDQVLLRPDLIPLFRNEDLEILVGDGTTSFLSERDIPNITVASDHLPILFKLNL